jgi:hypothetical protein
MSTATLGRVDAPAASCSTPPRSLQQRLDAIERANSVRGYRAALKKDLKRGRESVRNIIATEGDLDERLATMKVLDLLLALPKVGRVKANGILRAARISPSKTLAGMTERQRKDLVRALGIYPSTQRLARGQ